MRPVLPIFLATALLVVCAASAPAAAGETAGGVPQVKISGEGYITEMLVLGPFPNRSPEPGSGAVDGYDVDWLKDLGGEANARVDAVTVVRYDDNGVRRKAVATRVDGPKALDLLPLFRRREQVLAYGFVDIVCDEAMKAKCRFGSDDFAKVWLNGESVLSLEKRSSGRPMTPGEDEFDLSLRKGVNRLTVKLEQGTGGWILSAQILTPAALERAREADKAKERRVRFALNRFGPEDRSPWSSAHVPPANNGLPKLAFENPELADLMLKPDTLKIRWFDPDLNEVTKAEKPGLYCAYAEAELAEGGKYRRAVPVYLQDGPPPRRFIDAYTQGRPMAFPKDAKDFTAESWRANERLVTDAMRGMWREGMNFDYTALWYGEIALDRQPIDAWRETTFPNVYDYAVRLRRKVLGQSAEGKIPAPPAADPSATALRTGSETEAGFKPGAADAMRKVFSAWRDETELGLVALVARNGVVMFHEAFPGAQDPERWDPEQCPVTTATRLPTASVTKLHAGVLLARFLDQGLVGLDDPIGKFFPDYPAEGPKKVTVRQLMNHTGGFDWHGWGDDWRGGMINPFFDNFYRHQIDNTLPGTQYRYNGVDIDMGGKIVETVAGKPVFRVMREVLFEPLGQDRPEIKDLGWSLTCTAMDLARVAELLRQEGAYDGKRYFSRETFRTLLPRPVADTNPGLKDSREEYGVGISWMRDLPPVDDAPSKPASGAAAATGDDEEPVLAAPAGKTAPDAQPIEPEYIFGKNVFGHGSAAGTVMRIAPDLGLVVIVARYTPGENYGKHLSNSMKTIADHLVTR